MQFTAFVTAFAALFAVGNANRCTLNTCDADPNCGAEACTETVGLQTLYFYYCCNNPGVEIPPGGGASCPGCGGAKMFRRWSEIHALQAADLEKRELENRSAVEWTA